MIYIRIQKGAQDIPIIKLLKSKSKVTPLAVQTIPCLELIQASLLAKLPLSKTADMPTYYWTDSNVVLSWVSDHSAR